MTQHEHTRAAARCFQLIRSLQEKWTPENLASHLKMLHGSSNISTDLNQEKSLGFIVAHVRSNRYTMLEMHAIVKVCFEPLSSMGDSYSVTLESGKRVNVCL